MKYESVHDETYKGKDISIYTHEDGSYTVDVKKSFGELIAGWGDVENLEQAMFKAKRFIDEMNDIQQRNIK